MNKDFYIRLTLLCFILPLVVIIAILFSFNARLNDLDLKTMHASNIQISDKWHPTLDSKLKSLTSDYRKLDNKLYFIENKKQLIKKCETYSKIFLKNIKLKEIKIGYFENNKFKNLTFYCHYQPPHPSVDIDTISKELDIIDRALNNE